MVIVITDGAPTAPTKTAAEFEDLKINQFYVLNVLIGEHCQKVKVEQFRAMCHDWVFIDDPAHLVRELDVPLGNFLSGIF
jgi:hypothetical protein